MRVLSALFAAAAKADNIVFGIAADMDFSSGFLRLNTSPYGITIGGDVFSGVGSLGTVSAVSEEATLTAKGVSLTLSGIDPAIVSIALNDTYQGRPCKLWVCLFDNDHKLISTPYSVGTWRMDTMNIDIGKTATITLRAESALADWDRPRARYYTDGDQQGRYPGDLFFEHLAPNIDREILWGRT